MHAVVLHDFGPAENLRYESVADPVPGPGQVRIAVRAAGVHLVETMMRSGLESDMMPPLPELPSIFGGEVAGTVDLVGPGVDPAWTGLAVVTSAGAPGGYAELAVADLASVHRIPDGVTYEHAVAMVVTGTTALQLLEMAELTSDDVVLITSAAGGVGRLAVQYARRVGAQVIGAAGGPAKAAAVRELGADLAVDYNESSWSHDVAEKLGGRAVTVVLDGVGGAKAQGAFELIADGGRYLTIGSASQEDFVPDPEMLRKRDISAVDALALLLERPEEGPEFEARALAAVGDGTLMPSVQAFPLSEAAAAHAAIEARATTGKVVLVP
ncbi:NADPH quinone oxidoreductase [Streptomyces abyssalis]|uniref:NADPH quinone oxidoreductase n=1 Tax=Streptomyces abyssalis TaxID=933944 RepID=A0A1E7JGN9_9ACTN|nr:zinc-binding dehydrogenase [Streptomyces abyssalis]OEU85629.1 NADPH quinone oxidoreductase [Streptomyces abyssalis]OEU92906.1 NADPH quinone oxidoreductase [Streptomyces abyssalis]